VNVVDLMTLEPEGEHPHGLSDVAFDGLFTTDRPILFAFHGYPSLIHQLTCRRTNHARLHVRGYKDVGTTTTPFDMTVMNDLDRFQLVRDVVARVPGLAQGPDGVRADAFCRAKLDEHHAYIRAHGDDMPEVRDGTWSV
jgi:xylulose-5-phosphate/fructose-6-phosphate phosphoketolase